MVTDKLILVVDDDPFSLATIESALASAGYPALSAESAEEALLLLRQTRVDLCISDVSMPGLAGRTLRRMIRMRGATGRCPVIFISALPIGHPELSGIDGHHPKSAPIAALVERVRAILDPGEGRTTIDDSGRGFRAKLGEMRNRARHRLYRVAKRTLDLLIAFPAMLMLSPALLLVAAAIRAEDGGPVFFGQVRVGRGGRLFRAWKFRSMRVGSDRVHASLIGRGDDKDPVRFKMARDPRVTRVGRLIRRTSVDELPQLWNVLRGEMTLVGPRPPVPSETARYTPAEWRRLDVTPGLTCVWQVSGRADVPFPKQVTMDIDYIHERSLSRDIRLIADTVPAVFGGKGAY